MVKFFKKGTMIIYIDTPFKEEQKKTLRESVDDEFIFKDELKDKSEQEAALLKADILLGNPRPAALLSKAKDLKWIQLYSTGFEYYREVKTGAVVTNMQDYFSEPAAETIVAGILSLYRGIDSFSLLKSEKKWIGYPARNNLQMLNKKEVIILGAGNIGKRIAEILKAFDCKISFYARTSALANLTSVSELEKALPAADIIIGCLPGTAETHGLITKNMIDSLKSNCIFCNVGRGNLLAEENDLVDALMNNKIGGAVLDVTADEPLPASNPLWNCPNTILTQHSGGGSNTEYEGVMNLFLENLAAFKKGKPLKNEVKFERGY